MDSIILPAVTLAVARIATLSRLTRSSLRELRGQDYLRTATAKGAGGGRVWWRHALPNASAPILTVVAAQLASSLTGIVVIETVFAWPGIGTYYFEAVQFRDLPVIQAGMLLFCTAFVTVHLLVDFGYVVFDPRLRETA
ncbi:MAG: ABC transporter permease [Pleurocapsa sp. SU_196_0]|nr:ABC transporter permease [Pleurocapsa sp. SU_196_0]